MIKIKVLIADDHKLLAQSLRNALNVYEDFDVVGICHNSSETIWDIDLHHPDVLLLDLNMPMVGNDLPRATGFDVLENLKKKNSLTKTIIISSYNDYSLIKQSLNLGAMGYLLKNTSIDEISESIKSVWQGKKYIQKEVEDSFKHKLKHFDEDDSFVNSITLTKREKEVLEFISRGFKSEDIAMALNLKKSTIDEYRDNLIHKMGAKNAAELIRIAFESGLL